MPTQCATQGVSKPMCEENPLSGKAQLANREAFVCRTSLFVRAACNCIAVFTTISRLAF